MTSPLPISKQKDLGTRLVRTLGSLSKDVFEQRTSTGSEAISLLIYLNATKCALLSVFTLIKTIPLKIKKKKQLFKNAKSLLPVDVRCSCSREKRNIRVRDIRLNRYHMMVMILNMLWFPFLPLQIFHPFSLKWFPYFLNSTASLFILNIFLTRRLLEVEVYLNKNSFYIKQVPEWFIFNFFKWLGFIEVPALNN